MNQMELNGKNLKKNIKQNKQKQIKKKKSFLLNKIKNIDEFS